MATLVRIILSDVSSGDKDFHLGVLGESMIASRMVQAVNEGQIKRAKFVSIKAELVQTKDDLERFDGYFFFEGHSLSTQKLTFGSSRKQVENGIVIGMANRGTSPEVYMNVASLKRLKLSFSTSLMQFVTLVE